MTVRRTEYVSLRMDAELAGQVRAFATEHSVDRSEAIRLLIVRGLAVDDSQLTAPEQSIWSSSGALRSFGPRSYTLNSAHPNGN